MAAKRIELGGLWAELLPKLIRALEKAQARMSLRAHRKGYQRRTKRKTPPL